jgi:GH15 family glucan-1,4-alpha-glucosidase
MAMTTPPPPPRDHVPPGPHVLREYALLADGERGILVGPRGDFVWMCFPRWDSPAVFCSLIGGPGCYAVAPRDPCVWGGYYEPDTLIWRSRWITHDAIIECREALATPGHPDQAVILRRILAQHGPARLHVTLDPRAHFGHDKLHQLRRTDDGVWTMHSGDIYASWSGAPDAQPTSGRLELDIDLPAGAHHDLVLTLSTHAAGPPPDPERAWTATEAHWQRRVPALARAGPAERDARHAYAVLAGLTSAGGGMVAAATTSLPERARQGRNYDYRYVWIRDQCYAGQAVAAAGPHPLLDQAVRFVTERLLDDGPTLKPAYTITGGPVPDERRLELPGYPGGTDIVGNWVNQQFQLDAFGEALLLFAAAARHDHLDPDAWRAAHAAVNAIEARWQEPDAGIWEIDPDQWTHSRLICTAGLRAISHHPPGDRELAARWLALADTILADTATYAQHPSGRWQRSPTDPRPDAALLLPALRGALPADDPRSTATLHAVASELTQDGYCYRYQPDQRPLGDAEGAFLLCGFWLALAHAQRGDHVNAIRWFERNRAACGPPGLLSEEYDVRQRQLRGNLPQAFVHALLLETAVTLSAWRPEPAATP